MLGLPFLVGELTAGSGKEFMIIFLRLFRQVKIIVRGGPKEVGSWGLL